MTPIEAGARAYDAEFDKPQPEGELTVARHERCIRAALIAAVGALSDGQVDHCLTVAWNRHPDKRGQAFRAELVKQLTE